MAAPTSTPGSGHGKVPIEAVGFLGAVGVFLFLLIIFFLYLNKFLCFKNCGGFPCIDTIPAKQKNKLGHNPSVSGDGRSFSTYKEMVDLFVY